MNRLDEEDDPTPLDSVEGSAMVDDDGQGSDPAAKKGSSKKGKKKKTKKGKKKSVAAKVEGENSVGLQDAAGDEAKTTDQDHTLESTNVAKEHPDDERQPAEKLETEL